MAWIELHDTLPDHDKVLDVAEALKMDKDLVVGKLVRLWTWALNNREEGAFKARDIQTIAEVMRYKGKPQKLVGALVEAKLLDKTDSGYFIHDWDERVGMLLAKREASRSQARDRKRKQREKDGYVTRDISVTKENVTDECHDCHAATVPNHTVDISNDISPPIIPPKRFTPPTVDEVRAYCSERGNKVDGQTFVDFYSSKGWKVGNQPMKDWQAAVRTWEKREGKQGGKPAKRTHNHLTRNYTDAEINAIGRDLLEDV